MNKCNYNKTMTYILIVIVISVLIIPTKHAQAVTAISLNKTKATIYVGCSVKLKLENAKKVSWKSSDTSIAIVNSSGKVIGLKSGNVKVTALSNKKKYIATIKIKSCKLNESSITLTKGNGYNLSVLKTSAKIKWSSSNSSLVKVNSKGFITANNTGETIITAKVKNESYQCKVNVVDVLSYSDFNYSLSSSIRYKNFIDLTNSTGITCNQYFYNADPKSSAENRGITIGDKYKDVITKYGYSDKIDDASFSNNSDKSSNEYMARTYIEYKYSENNNNYYKRFCFDLNNNLRLIIWHSGGLK